MEVVILGTSSAAPTVRRGLSSLALIREGETFLFDCGEGTQFRMLKAEIPRRKLHHIFITHLHGDHIFGLGGLLSSLNLSEREPPLHIHGPKGIKRFVDFMTTFPRPTKFGFEIHAHEIAPNTDGPIWETRDWIVYTAPLDHTIPAMGFRLQEKDLLGRFDSETADQLGVPFGPERGRLQRGESIVLSDGRTISPELVVGPPRPGKAFAYCTDTAYCGAAQRLSVGVDLLVHEATYGDAELELARDRKHSTIRQAATIARDAEAKAFVATHFSTRYEGPSLDVLAKEGREVYPSLMMAKDLMRIEL